METFFFKGEGGGGEKNMYFGVSFKGFQKLKWLSFF